MIVGKYIGTLLFSLCAALTASADGTGAPASPAPSSATTLSMPASFSIHAPAGLSEKSSADSLVYWGPYFFCFKSDPAFRDLLHQSAAWGSKPFTTGSIELDISIPQEGRVHDLERIFTAPQSRALDSLIEKYEAERKGRIALVTIDGSWVIDETALSEMGDRLFREWNGNKPAGAGPDALIVFSAGMRKVLIKTEAGSRTPVHSLEYVEKKLFAPELEKRHYFTSNFYGLNALTALLR